MRLGLLLSGLLVVALPIEAVYAEPPAAPRAVQKKKRSSKPVALKRPITIKAATFEVRPAQQKAVGTGNVLITRDDLTIRCDALEATYDKKSEIKSMVCSGNAYLLQKPTQPGKPEREAWGAKAVFDNTTATLVVTGAPKAREGANTMTGSKVTFHVDEERLVIDDVHMEVESSKTAPILQETKP